MKKLLLLFLGLVPVPVFGFVATDADISRSSLTVLVQSYADKADFTVSHTLKNNTDSAQSFDYVLPARQVLGSPNVFWKSDGQTVTALNQTQAAEVIFNQARNFNQPAWLAAMDQSFDSWWQIENLTLEPNQTAVLRLEYQSGLDFFNNVYLGELWLADGRASEALTINLVRAGQPTVWDASIGNWTSEKTNEAWASQWQSENETLTENLVFWASEVDASTLTYNFLDKAYQAQFKALEAIEIPRVVLIIDTSGSVYGVRLERLKQAFRTMLEALPANTELKVGLASDELEWIQTDWTLNNRDNQREILTFIEGAQAQGPTDWEAVITALNLEANRSFEAYGLVWLGDFSDLPEPLLNRVANAGWKMLMIDFWQSNSSYLQRWWQRYNGQYVPLFNFGFELVEADTLRGAWRKLLLTWPALNTIDEPLGSDWFEPVIINQTDNNKALGQTNRVEQTSTLASFLPRWWAQYKIADYLRQHEGLPLNEAQVQAVLSIAHAFGVNVFDFNGKSSFTDFNAALASVETDVLWDEILRMHSTAPEAGIRYWQSKPFYQVGERWEPFDWETYSARFDRPVLELWSAAHQNLFTQQASLLAKPMSFGIETAFCAGERCASVAASGRSEPDLTDSLLWNLSAADHWALGYWADLLWAEVLTVETLDQSEWAEPVSRGQFLVWLQQHLAPQAILPSVDNRQFSDIEVEQLGASQALWFAQQGLFNGYSDGTARLDQPLLRIEGLKLLMTAYGLDTRDVLGNYDAKMPFTDLIGWTQPWGYEAYLRGLVDGYPDNTFRPFQSLTQAESFKLLVEAKRLIGD